MPLQKPCSFPLLTDVHDLYLNEEGKSMKFKIFVTTFEHIYLNSHVFGDSPLMPGAVLMEVISESAALLSTRLGLSLNSVRKINNFEILRPIFVGVGEIVELKIEAYLVPTDHQAQGIYTFHVSVFSDSKNNVGKIIRRDKRHSSANVVLQLEPSGEQIDTTGIPEKGLHYDITKEGIYQNFITTHGPLFKSLNGKMAVYPQCRGVAGEFSNCGLEAGFIANNKGEFLLSPLAIDSAFQLVIVGVRLTKGYGRLPIGGNELIFYEKPKPFATYKIIAQNLKEDEEITSFSIKVVSDDGYVVFSFKEFHFKRNSYNSWENFDESKSIDILERFRVP